MNLFVCPTPLILVSHENKNSLELKINQAFSEYLIIYNIANPLFYFYLKDFGGLQYHCTLIFQLYMMVCIHLPFPTPLIPVNKGNNKIIELRTIFQRESQNS